MMYSSLDWQSLATGLSVAQGAMLLFGGVLLTNYAATLWFAGRFGRRSAAAPRRG